MVVGALPPQQPPDAVSGCIEVFGTPIPGAAVKFTQAKSPKQAATTVTDSSGCYTFDAAVTGKGGTLTVQLPPFQ
jgi:hypothetical protein